MLCSDANTCRTVFIDNHGLVRAQGDVHKTKFGLKQVIVPTIVRDARYAPNTLSLDRHGFTLKVHPTALSESDFFAGGAKLEVDYYDEIKDLIKKSTGAKHVLVIHHQVRR